MKLLVKLVLVLLLLSICFLCKPPAKKSGNAS